LIPSDPTILLTNAGMVPFKTYMMGLEESPWKRAVSVQKCFRAVDIDQVGRTKRHLTFFEMLGNFSFGDYYKEKAIPWAYEYITEVLGLDHDRLWYTVHETDEEARQVWVDIVGVPAERVQVRGRENFWQMGIPGPAGPSSEIFYDKGAEFGSDGGPIADEERFVEFWNLVFMEQVQDEPYHVIGELPVKNIDTGAGLARVAALVQDVGSVFEIDTMREILAAAENATGVRYGATPLSDISLRKLADHGRAVTFLLSDKVVPSNQGRGHVVRRLIRAATQHAFRLGVQELIMPTLVSATVDVMKDGYPELAGNEEEIVMKASAEEQSFRKILESGHRLLDRELSRLRVGQIMPGSTVFKLHDTYGFPREMTEEILAERGVDVDNEGFERLMDQQRERARRARDVGKGSA